MPTKRKAETIENVPQKKQKSAQNNGLVDERQQPFLLALPRELRDEIWAFAVAQNSNIQYTPELRTPALARTCKQIRLESLPLWIRNYWIEVHVEDCSPVMLEHMDSFLGRLHEQCDVGSECLPAATVWVVGVGKQHAGNLKQWCKLVWEDRFMPILKIARAQSKLKVVMSAHEIARKHIGKSWSDCEEALDNLLFAVGGLDPRWELEWKWE